MVDGEHLDKNNYSDMNHNFKNDAIDEGLFL